MQQKKAVVPAIYKETVNSKREAAAVNAPSLNYNNRLVSMS